ncbi:hypothetical protein COV05_04250 [Candidatus Uhrbacteria bacterium CG10_big_fil_rev_8_21_14_0_10_48_16]|uniref:PPM-type phosphatase domain-containing protein n=1 Tax=Candidatus Uhrbacteria bacterium CG10_big_fil_rev_8_21_14_0_10_48_16 TaxID=1975038 RepID=A0A2M8LGH5_9BACT|nr:MAG: hypothetical protein COV05_04250 [Candidatus Uhrbacteria bacterium CG10_big_fil_rev_8_21_14_0_10_48_16]
MRGGVVKQEQRGEQLPSKEEYLALFEKEWAEIHEGKMPEIGLKVEGRAERKETCEDVKLKNREKGIFLVADGVSSAKGWLAARETARTMYELLGESLDKQIENNLQEALREGEDPVERITSYIGAQITTAIEQAHTRIQAMAVQPEFKGSATTLSMAKLIDLPDGNGGHLKRLFFANVGDSRIYVQRKGGELQQVTQDDSRLQLRVERGEITQEQARQIDQVEDPSSLPADLRAYARGRAIITKSIGLGDPTEGLGVFFLDLQPGDRFVIVSDGVSDQLVENQIEASVNGNLDDAQAEEGLQKTSMEMSLDGRHPRAKGDDISALVHTVEETGQRREYLRSEVRRQQTEETLQATVRKLKEVLAIARERVQRADKELQGMDAMMPKRERISLMLEKEQAVEQESLYAYHLEKTQLDLFDQQVPPRFEAGARVDMWRDDFDPPSLDRQPWTVTAYDAESKTYVVRGAGGIQKEISRYALENVQHGLLVRVGDTIPAPNEMGAMEKGFKIVAFDTDGTVVLMKEKEGVVKRSRMKAESANEAFFGLVYRAERSKNGMDHAIQTYHQAKERQQALKDEAVLIERLESRQRALDLAQEKISAGNLEKEIAKMERRLQEFKTLEEEGRFRGLSSQKEARRKELALLVYGSRTTLSLEQLLQQKKQELKNLLNGE